MSLVTLRNITLSYASHPLFDNANLVLQANDRACIIGRNGAGKSTLLKLLLGQVQPDKGIIEKSEGLTISLLPQEIPRDLTGTAFDCVAAGLGDIAQLLKAYEATSIRVADTQLSDDEHQQALTKLQGLQEALDTHDAWVLKQRVDSALSQVSIDPHLPMQGLSGGQIRRVLLAAAILQEPDILLLDEPTNHLDIDSIIWLENFLVKYPKTLLFITHDRSLVKKIATRIIEVDHGQILSWKGNYAAYLTHKAQALQAEEKSQREFDKKLAEEEVWIRQGVKARRTRNEGRVRKLEKMREQFQQRQKRIGTANFRQQSVELSGKLVYKLHKVNYQRADKPIIHDFSTVLSRGDKVGIIGPNGCGKSTLLNIMLGNLTADSGKIRAGTNLNIAYFDQQREQLDENQTVIENIFHGCEFVTIGNKEVHVMTYLRDFLFTPERARVSVRSLSGGERHRLLLARLFTKPCNVLILDEPTNDLDQETLELLEERLLDYDGTLLLVSHDREFLDNVVTSTWVFEGEGNIAQYVGGYQDYLRQRPKSVAKKPTRETKSISTAAPKTPQKLSYKEQRELDSLPGEIEADELTLEDLQQRICQADFYKQALDDIKQVTSEIERLETKLATAYARWEVLLAR